MHLGLILPPRRFCRARGIALPYRAESRAKAEGLAQALRALTSTTRTPRTLRVLTDFDGGQRYLERGNVVGGPQGVVEGLREAARGIVTEDTI